uniref:Uncharacterized protein n=1 Tax=Aegilops tauschii subsp. strangulata TaxID=200361 RepID=A0A453S9V1_AEGTS
RQLLTDKYVELFQVKELNFQGYEVILVTSGTVGIERQRLE